MLAGDLFIQGSRQDLGTNFVIKDSMHEFETTVNYPETIRHLELAIELGDEHAMRQRVHLHEKLLCNNKKDAHCLLELLWDDLLIGRSFTPYTLLLLKSHCRGAILEKLISTVNFTEEQIFALSEDNHVIAQMLGIQSLTLMRNEVHDLTSFAQFIHDCLNSRALALSCPITLKLISKPVSYTTSNGVKQIFEKEALKRWRTKASTCPMTREDISTLSLALDDEFDLEAQQQISILRPFLIDNDVPISSLDIETKLRNNDMALYSWIRGECRSAIVNNDEIVKEFANHVLILSAIEQKLKRRAAVMESFENLAAAHSFFNEQANVRVCRRGVCCSIS
jgi:hypothetical protein